MVRKTVFPRRRISPHEVPDRAPCLRIEAGRQLIEQHHLGIVNQGQCDEERCFCPPESVMNQASRLSARPRRSSSASPSTGADKAMPQIDRLPHLDSLLKLSLLELHAYFLLKGPGVADRIERQHRDRSSIRATQPFDALHRRCFARAIGADEPEDLTFLDVERHVVDGDRPAVRLANRRDLDDRRHLQRPNTRSALVWNSFFLSASLIGRLSVAVTSSGSN